MKKIMIGVVSLVMTGWVGMVMMTKPAAAFSNQFRVRLVGDNGVWIECWASKSFCQDLPRYLVYPAANNLGGQWVRRRLYVYRGFHHPTLFTAYFTLPSAIPWFRIETYGQKQKTKVFEVKGKWRVVNKADFVQFHRVGWRPGRF